jgi:hypothetical protein
MGKISIAPVGMICNRLSHHHSHKLPFHVLLCTDKCDVEYSETSIHHF